MLEAMLEAIIEGAYYGTFFSSFMFFSFIGIIILQSIGVSFIRNIVVIVCTAMEALIARLFK